MVLRAPSNRSASLEPIGTAGAARADSARDDVESCSEIDRASRRAAEPVPAARTEVELVDRAGGEPGCLSGDRPQRVETLVSARCAGGGSRADASKLESGARTDSQSGADRAGPRA